MLDNFKIASNFSREFKYKYYFVIMSVSPFSLTKIAVSDLTQLVYYMLLVNLPWQEKDISGTKLRPEVQVNTAGVSRKW